jgi:hypothetical protein
MPRHLTAIRLSDAEHSSFTAAAKKAGLTLSAWMRLVMLNASGHFNVTIKQIPEPSKAFCDNLPDKRQITGTITLQRQPTTKRRNLSSQLNDVPDRPQVTPDDWPPKE